MNFNETLLFYFFERLGIKTLIATLQFNYSNKSLIIVEKQAQSNSRKESIINPNKYKLIKISRE